MADKWICLSDADRELLTRLIRGYMPGDMTATDRTRLEKKLNPKRIKNESAKGKGRDFQQWTCRAIAGILDVPYDQQDDQCLVHAREMGQPGVDVVLRGPAYDAFPFDVECKSTELLNITDTIRQAQANTKPGRDWLVLFRSRVIKDPVAIVAWSVFRAYALKLKGRKDPMDADFNSL